MVALGSGRGHNRSVRDWRAVVSADCACHASGDGYDHHPFVGSGKYGNNDRNQDAERPPGCACCKCQEASYQENDGWKQIHKSAGSRILTPATYSAAPRLSVIAFNVHANVRIRIAGTMALNPSGTQDMDSLNLSTFLAA